MLFRSVRVYKDGTIKAKKAGKAIVVAKVKKNGVTNKYYVVVRVTDGKTKSNTSYLKVIK